MTHKPSAGESTELKWFRSSYSDSSNSNECVEVATTPGAVHVRDSKDDRGPHLGFAPTTWEAFLAYASAN
ncbi:MULTISPECIES: DUF397 domain-containing protein [Streptomyces]|jgi:hypothetical protein|uniref:DUF397 domain-containing protein n=1 Tax=Streptomyces TaxID=1883 RepID=UPI0004BE376B|nr:MULTISPECIES: DUF397 domain-containing protein [Streptomyces]MDF9872785.1 hypothetical protein [Streptomyces pratensis]MCY1651194.1 DUF397 domain-containing protein [Streptomyces sp. SL203]MCY1681641.1 DUF397 domain-containing protein [Streptomyces sp. SL294]MDF6062139.1 DUF397 domain-containing protein [Streptomyces sp. JH010]MDX2620748.1 DUF397 domain-containing protein [Streptomyces sp. WI03-5b]